MTLQFHPDILEIILSMAFLFFPVGFMGFDIAGYSVNLRQRVGKGAMGNVYMATDKDGTTIAAKQVDDSRSEKSAVRELLNARKHKGLNHENIVNIFNMHIDEDIWVFMEYCEGRDLSKYATNHYAAFQNDRINIMSQIGCGLAFLHGANIVHRDVKPENILIQPQAGIDSVTVKLADFGLAKFHEPYESTTAMDTHIGTGLYMAPEFWNRDTEGHIRYNKSVDMYALGLTFLAMIKAEKGKALKPSVENITETEWALPIGAIMYNRNKTGQESLDVVTTSEHDNFETLTIKALIRKAIAFRSADRPKAYQIVKCLEGLTNKPHVETYSTILEHTKHDAARGDAAHSQIKVIYYKYANCVYFVIVATEFFTNWNAIEGLGRGDFRTVSVT